MALMKYSVGGPITTVADAESTEKREETPESSMANEASYIIVCKQCQIQHMILQGEINRTCFCGNIIKLGELS